MSPTLASSAASGIQRPTAQSVRQHRPGLSLFLATAFILLCIAQAQAQDFGQAHQPAPSAPSTFQSGGVVPIGPGDLLEVTVFDTPELSGKVRVSNTGDVSLPLVGSVHVGGLKTDEMQALLAKKLIDGQFVKQPQVSVFMAEYATAGVSVVGEVKKPGIYPTLGNHRLLDYISLAEGLTPMASTQVTITQRGNPAATTITLPSLSSPTAAQNPDIAPGDTIFVAKAGIVYVVGDVSKPGGFALDHDQHLTVLQAVALAGGVNSTANKKGAKVVRKGPNGPEEIPLDLAKVLSARSHDAVLQNDDILFIPDSRTKTAFKNMGGIMASAAAAAIYHF
ncbi:MAG: polysaccharide biosynthesis/export family protein [Candidatus Angelobacter sp.]